MPVIPVEPIIRLPKESSLLPKDTQPKEAKCDCTDCFKKRTDEDTAQSAIDFENQIQDFVYVKYSQPPEPKHRKRRDLLTNNDPTIEFPIMTNGTYRDTQQEFVTERDPNDNSYKVFVDTVNSTTTSYVLRELKHYTMYTIHVIACRAGSSTEGAPNCSAEAKINGRTNKLEDADNIRTEDVFIVTEKTNNTNANVVRVAWKNPPNPNGFIASVTVYYKRIDEKFHVEKAICVSQRISHQNSTNQVLIDNLETGNYSYRLLARSIAGSGKYTEPKYHMIHEPPSYAKYYIIGSTLLLAVLVFIFLYKVRAYFSPNISNMKLIASVNPDYAGVMYKQDNWEVPREKITLLQELGQGSFGMVSGHRRRCCHRRHAEQHTAEQARGPVVRLLIGQPPPPPPLFSIAAAPLGERSDRSNPPLHPSSVSLFQVYQGIVRDLKREGDHDQCAIKTVNENLTDKERLNFLNEASVMKQFDTHHVVRLLGVVSCGHPTLVIMELMANGDLKGYLRSHRPEYENGTDPPPQPPTLRRILQMAIEIADGMAYLSAKKFVHRDLAARNCMVAEDMTVKIGDFGMTRDIYETDYYRKGTKGLLPVRWMSPESLKDGVFASSSDIFSYGVVLWEMATLASQPYQVSFAKKK